VCERKKEGKRERANTKQMLYLFKPYFVLLAGRVASRMRPRAQGCLGQSSSSLRFNVKSSGFRV